jgi:UDPglucose 6-dehydrogenase
VGTGYVGLATGAALANLGNSVICVDTDEEKIANLTAGNIPFYEKGLEELVAKNLSTRRLSFTTNLSTGVASSDIIFVAVGTPVKSTGGADLSQIISVTKDLVKVMADYRIIVVKSTVPVGTSELILDIFVREGMTEGEDFDMVFNPEFLREGDALYDFFHPTRIVIGSNNERAGQKVAELFNPLKTDVIFTTIANAKMIKYAANTFLASRISFINEIANICERVGADVREVARGLGYDRRLGNGYLSAGIGFGGPCLTKDLKALIKMAENYGYEPYHLKSILEKNEHQVREVVRKIREAMGGTLYNKRIGILGLAFKAETSDVRDSNALRIIELLKDQGATIRAYDPLAMPEAKKILCSVEYVRDAYSAAEGSDALVILADWDEFKDLNLGRIKKLLATPIIIDGRNIYEPDKMTEMGFNYRGVGR